MTDFTSAKSRLIRPGVVIRSVMPWTPESSTWSAALNASSTLTCRSEMDSSRSFGITISVSTSSRSRSMPASAWHAAALALEAERAGHHADGERAERAGHVGHHGRAAGAGAAALARGDEDHVGALEHLLDLLAVVFGGLAADVGVGARAQTAGELAPDVELDVGVAHQQRLGVGIDRDELDALESLFDHPVHGVDAAPADTDDLDDRQIILRCCHEEGPFPLVCLYRVPCPPLDGRCVRQTGNSTVSAVRRHAPPRHRPACFAISSESNPHSQLEI